METKVLSIDAQKAISELAKLTQEIERLTAANALLKKEIKEKSSNGEIESAQALANVFEEQHKVISVLTEQRRILRREIENSVKQDKYEAGSLRSLRAELSRLTSAYDSMSRARREGAEGTALLESIQKVSKEISVAEQASLRFQRNVGNYQSAFGNLSFQVQQLARELPSLSYGFNVFIGAISNNLPMLVDEIVRARREYQELLKVDPSKAVPVWKQLFSSVISWQTALVAGITVLTLYGREIGNWIESLFKGKKAVSDIYETMEEFHEAVGGGSGSMLADLEKLSVEWRKLGNNMKDKQKFIEDNADAFDELGVSITTVEEAENALIKNKTAFENSIIARAKAAATMDLAAEEYKKAVQKMMEADKMPDTVKEFKQTGTDTHGAMQGEWVNVENKDKKAATDEATAIFASGDDLVREASEYSAKAQAELDKAGIKAKAVNADKVKDAADTVDKIRDMKAIELEEIRKAEDLIYKNIKDSRAKQEELIYQSYERQRQDLEARLEKETDLSETARLAINQQIIELEKQCKDELFALSEEELQKEIEIRQKTIELKLAAVKEGTAEEFALRLEALAAEMEIELTNAELTEEQKLLVRKKYAKLEQDLVDKQNAETSRRQAEALKMRFEVEMSAMESAQSKKLDAITKIGASEDLVKQAQYSAELEMLKLQKEQQLSVLRDMHREKGETEDEYNARRTEAQRAVDETQLQITETKVAAQKDAYGQLSDAIEALGENSEAFTKLSKVLALAEIGLNTAKAIAAMTAAEAPKGILGLLTMASGIATILANMAQATKIVNSLKFAGGGLVTGEGTATSDSIPAMLSNGESVLTAKATSMFAPVLSTFNQIGGGVPIQTTETANSVAGEEMLARAFMKGAASLPNPVVSVVDINAGQTRVAQVESLSNL